MTAEPHIRTDRLSKRYPGADRPAVDGLSLEVSRGSIFGILGPNGAGKTTTLSMLSGLLRPDGGRVRYAGGIGPLEMRRRLGLVPQDLALYGRLTARENLAFFGGLYGVDRGALRGRIDSLLDVAGLADRADDRVDRYSNGMKRRLNVVAALVHEPEVVLLDEPTVGVDPQSRNRIFEMVRTLRERGVTLLYTTHYMEEASRLCDRIAIVDHGDLLVEDEPGPLVQRLGTTRVELALEGPAEDIAEELEALPEVTGVESSEGRLSLAIGGDEAALDVVQRAAEVAAGRGVHLALRSVAEPTLESVFLGLTGRELRDEEE